MPVRPGSPYTRSAWLALPQAKRGFKSYDRYRQWWQGNVGPKVQQRSGRFGLPSDPLSPIDQNALFGMANDMINAQINPLIDHYLGQLDRRGRASMDRLRGATQDFVRGVSSAAPTISRTWDESINSARGVQDAMVSFAQGQGQAADQHVTQSLQAINAPEASIAANADTLGSLGQGIAGQQLGSGGASLLRMLSDRATDVTEAANYPAFAANYGMNAARDLESQIADERADISSNFASQIPGLVRDTYQTLLDRELQKAIAREGFDIDRMGSSGGASAPDLQWKNTPQGSFAFNPATGEYQAIPGTKGDPKPKKGQSVSTTGITQAGEKSNTLHESMMKTFAQIADPTNPSYAGWSPQQKKQYRQKLLQSTRDQAVRSVYGALEAYYPGKSKEWKHKTAASILRQGGWEAAAQAIEGGGFAPSGVAAPASPRGPARPPTGRPTAAQPTPSRRVEPRQPPGDRGGPAQADRSGAKTTQERAKAAQHKRDEARRQLESRARQWKSQGVDRNRAEQIAYQSLKRVLKGVPDATVRSQARQIVARAYGG